MLIFRNAIVTSHPWNRMAGGHPCVPQIITGSYVYQPKPPGPWLGGNNQIISGPGDQHWRGGVCGRASLHSKALLPEKGCRSCLSYALSECLVQPSNPASRPSVELLTLSFSQTSRVWETVPDRYIKRFTHCLHISLRNDELKFNITRRVKLATISLGWTYSEGDREIRGIRVHEECHAGLEGPE